jgi:hypothetical protein
MNYSIDDLRHDIMNLDDLSVNSPLYLEILNLTKRVHFKLSERLSYDQTDFADAFNTALIYLIQPMSSINSKSPLEHYLVVEYERRQQIGEPLSISELRKLLYTSIKNLLLKTHTSGYVEALVTRSVRILKSEIEASVSQDGSIFTVTTKTDPVVADSRRILAVANKCSYIEKLPQISEVRNSIVYSPQNLQKIIEILISQVDQFQKDDLFELFQYLLTNWLPTNLSTSDETTARTSETKHSSEGADSTIGSFEYSYQHAHRIWLELSENQRRFLHANTWEATHAQIARRVQFIDNRNPDTSKQYSRVWVINLQQETMDQLRQDLEDLEVDEHLEILRLIREIATNYKF